MLLALPLILVERALLWLNTPVDLPKRTCRGSSRLLDDVETRRQRLARGCLPEKMGRLKRRTRVLCVCVVLCLHIVSHRMLPFSLFSVVCSVCPWLLVEKFSDCRATGSGL